MEERTSTYRLVTDADELAGVAGALENAETVGADIETTSLSPRDGKTRLLQLATPEETFVVDVFAAHDLSPLKRVLEDGPVKALHNGKFDHSFLWAEHGISLSPIFDTMLAAQLLDGGEYGPSYALEAVAERYLEETVDKTARGEDWSGELSSRQLQYAAGDAAILLPLRERLAEALESEELGLVSEIEFEAVAAIAEMELAGIKLDVARWKELEKTVRERRDRAAERLEAHFPAPDGVLPLEGLGPQLNLNSPQQITDAFRQIGIELPDTRVWTLLKIDHQAARDLLEYRELQKKLGTYLETYASFIHPKTRRIHANFLQCRVPTGRLACTNPNIQQVPHEGEFRRCFVAEEGNILVIADYSQIELRILAEVSDDPGFVEAFQKGEDLHRVTAATMFGVEKEAVTKEQRSAAKRINFGLAYGRGPKSLSAQIGTDEDRARELIDEYFANYPKVQKYLQGAANEAMRTRTLRTLSARVRKFGNTSGLSSMERGALRREAMNYPIQGCLSGDARVFEKSAGYVPIRSLVGRAVSVWDGERFSRASVVHSGKKRLTRVVLKGGHLIECSPDHKFLVRNNINGGEAWKRAGEIRRQDRVVLADKLPVWELEPSLPLAEPGRSWNAGSPDLLEIGSRKELGEWLGRVGERKAGSAAYGRAQKVESVEVTDEWVEMYDVVNSETGRFAANGIVVHNSSADIAKLALGYIRREIRDLDARLINCIHDEFVVECAEGAAPEVSEKMKGAMIRAGEELLEKVPVEVEVAVSRDWTK